MVKNNDSGGLGGGNKFDDSGGLGGGNKSDDAFVGRRKSPIFRKLAWIRQYSPAFWVRSKDVQILRSPEEYYRKLNELISGSRQRIILSSLYLGTGKLEQDLVANLQKALNGSDGIRSTMLLDYSRGQRGPPSSLTVLRPVISRANSKSHKFRLFLYHTPRLRGFVKWLLPGRWNEVIGVQHMKVGVFDDNVVLSGANLSDSYFTNRQDRYMVIRNSPQLADFYEELVESVTKSSFRVDKGSGSTSDGGDGGNSDEFILDDGHLPKGVHPFNGDYNEYAAQLRRDMEATMDKWQSITARQPRNQAVQTSSGNDEQDTLIYPLIQVGPIGVTREDVVLTRILGNEMNGNVSDGDRIDMASGYFNLTDEYRALILRNRNYQLNIVSASPKANGFWDGAGLSKYVPTLYTQVLKEFFHSISSIQNACKVQLYEWCKEGGWTFHGKGLWWTLKGEQKPSATFIGSTNFGYRSVHRDLETQIAVLTDGEELRSQLDAERNSLFDTSSYAEPVTPELFQRDDHFVPLWMRVFYGWMRSFF